jgi:F-type H+-transporting ATPase subunit epsilon
MNFHAELVSPERKVFSGDVTEVVIPSANGDMGILANHAPIVAVLRPGMLTIKGGASPKSVYVRGGFAEVNAQGLSILAERVVPAEELTSEILAGEIALLESEFTKAKSDRAKQTAALRVSALKSLQASK